MDIELPHGVGRIAIGEADPRHRYARFCLHEFYSELDRRFAIGFDPADSEPAEPDDMCPPAGVFLLATVDGEPVGCGALKFHGDEPTELKRMWVSPEVRGLGVGRRLLGELEKRVATVAGRVIRLETNQALTEAIAMYRTAGYRQVAPFSDEPYATHWFEKTM